MLADDHGHAGSRAVALLTVGLDSVSAVLAGDDEPVRDQERAPELRATDAHVDQPTTRTDRQPSVVAGP